MVRVIVTDDSAFMRKILSDIINSDPDLEVVATARNGKDLLDKLVQYKPDVITLDISMPVMDGIETLKRIMKENPMPVIMISALSDDDNVFTCLNLGAVDFIPKTSGIISIDMAKKKDEIISKIKSSVQSKIIIDEIQQKFDPEGGIKKAKKEKVICIGASTGGPKAIESILRGFPKDFLTPIIVVQHLPEEFTASFANRLDGLIDLKVKLAKEGEEIKEGEIYVAPGGYHLEIKDILGKRYFRLNKNPPELGVRPSVNVTLRSLAPIYKDNLIAVILTGMGEDGTDGLRRVKEYQDELKRQKQEKNHLY